MLSAGPTGGMSGLGPQETVTREQEQNRRIIPEMQRTSAAAYVVHAEYVAS